MNRFLADILAQPEALQLLLIDLTKPNRAFLVDTAMMISNAQRVMVTSMGGALFSSMPMYTVLRSAHPNASYCYDLCEQN